MSRRISVLMSLALLSGSRPRIEEHGKASLAALFYVMNWMTALQLIPWSPLSHTWSLSSEEQFYLLWPLILWGLFHVNARPRVILGLVAAMIVGLTLYRAWLWSLQHSAVRVYYCLDTHADGLITGCLLAMLFSFGIVSERSRAGPWGWPALALIVAVAAVGTIESSVIWYGGLTAVNLSAALIIASLLCAPDGTLARLLRSAPMAWLGRLSYGIYLWHYPIFLVVERKLGAHGRVVSIAASLAATIAVSTASFYLLERPLLRLKKHRAAPAGERS